MYTRDRTNKYYYGTGIIVMHSIWHNTLLTFGTERGPSNDAFQFIAVTCKKVFYTISAKQGLHELAIARC
jgi:hypothetical protein